MAKYVLEEYVVNGYNASSKAREDVSKILLECGYNSIGKNDKREISKNKLKKVIMAMKIYSKLATVLKKEDIVFIHTSMVVLKGILRIKKLTHFRVVYLVHDMFSLQYDDYNTHKNKIDDDISKLNQCDIVICHNERMKKKLREFGCKTQLRELEIFDYLLDSSLETAKKEYSPKEVAFAGNLAKSMFLYDLDKKGLQEVKFNIYGYPVPKYSTLNYCGAVAADKLPFAIQGNYGLIWEGNYIPEEKDNYTRYNNPHKASLYLVSGLPLIVWNKAAISDFVRNYHVGIMIDSLDEIAEKLEKISSDEYEEMQKNIKIIREKLTTGYFLKTVLDKIN